MCTVVYKHSAKFVYYEQIVQVLDDVQNIFLIQCNECLVTTKLGEGNGGLL